MAQIIDDLNWRYATKTFDPEKKVSKEDLEILLEALRLTPSSFGLQPWGFVVVETQEILDQLVPVSWNQQQVAQASQTFVLCRKESVDEAYVDSYIADLCQKRGMKVEDMSGFSQVIKNFLSKYSEESLINWMSDQIYIALGQLITVAATMKIDACPMEGFDSDAYDKILGLKEKGLRSVVVCPVGYRASDDKYATLTKIRWELDDVVVRI
ncbi:MAG: NAD(P)H-dependent oxidoreductase [Limnothrix sp. RL_2_0]|nr:NAD(P)H-dependent oxidoreductase [Limnothrix sp. RL_2_0]